MFNLCLQGLHSASIPGILALDLQASDTSKVLTGKGGNVKQPDLFIQWTMFWLIDWLIDWLIGWLSYCLIDEKINW